MSGAPFFIVAEIAIPDAGQCARWIGPTLAVVAALWLIRRMDRIIEYLFPHWGWEKKLGWLNLTAHRRAESFLRWLGYFVYAVLGGSLLGIVWAAQGLSTITRWDDPKILSELLFRVPVLLVCLGFWFVYLWLDLVPRLRGQYEEEELQKFRAEQEELEREQEMNPASRMKSPLHKTRVSSSVGPSRIRPRG